MRKAHARTGVAATDFSCIRNGDLSRITIDRLINTLGKLDQRVDVQVTVRRRKVIDGTEVRTAL